MNAAAFLIAFLFAPPASAQSAATAPGRWPPEEAARLQQEIARTTGAYAVHAYVGPLVTPIPPDLAEFLLDHPDLSAAIVRKHKIAPYRIEMHGPSFSTVDDGAGIQGSVMLAEKMPERRAYIADGTYSAPAFPSIHATAVIFMDIHTVERPGCLASIRSGFDMYVRLKNPVLSGLLKAMQALLRKAVVRKFSKAFLAAHETAKLIDRDPDGMEREILAFPGLSPADRSRASELITRLRAQPAECRSFVP